MSSRFIKRQIPLILVFIVGVIITFDWFFKYEPLQTTAQTLMNFQVILFSAMVWYSMVNLNVVHTKSIRRNLKEKKYYDVFTSTLLIGFLIIATIIGIFIGSSTSYYKFIYNYFYTPLSYTVGVLVMLNIASATYRLVRPRSKELFVLFLVTIVTLFINIPASYIYFPFLQGVKTWFTDILVKSSYRAITIGLGLAGLLLGLRVLLGKETNYMGGD